MITRFSLFLSGLFLSIVSFSQPAIQWQKTIGGGSTDLFSNVIETTDGGYLLCGTSYSDVTGEKTESCFGGSDYWIVKTDNLCNIEWQKTYGGNLMDILNSAIQTSDGGYLLGGNSDSEISGNKTEAKLGSSDYWVLKLDNSGEIEWQHTFGGNSLEGLNSVIQTTDDGYLVAGYSRSDVNGNKTAPNFGSDDMWLIKLNNAGSVEWQKTYGGSYYDYAITVIQNVDGDYVVGGYSDSGISETKTEGNIGSYDYWVIQLDNAGEIEWQNVIGGSLDDYFRTFIQTSDGGYLIGGISNSSISGDKSEYSLGEYDYWMVKINSTGGLEWQNTLGSNSVERFRSVIQTSDGGYLLGGSSFSSVYGDKSEECLGADDFWAIKVDATGNIVWQNTIGGNGEDDLEAVVQTSDGGFLLAGTSTSGISADKTDYSRGSYDYWVVKLASEEVGISSPLSETISIYPNPAIHELQIETASTEASQIFIEDLSGKIIDDFEITTQKTIDVSTYAPGIYIIRMVRNNQSLTQKFVVL